MRIILGLLVSGGMLGLGVAGGVLGLGSLGVGVLLEESEHSLRVPRSICLLKRHCEEAWKDREKEHIFCHKDIQQVYNTSFVLILFVVFFIIY